MDAMNKKIISKVGKRHRPEIDMMEYIQIEETREFDLDKYTEKPVTTTTNSDKLEQIKADKKLPDVVTSGYVQIEKIINTKGC